MSPYRTQKEKNTETANTIWWQQLENLRQPGACGPFVGWSCGDNCNTYTYLKFINLLTLGTITLEYREKVWLNIQFSGSFGLQLILVKWIISADCYVFLPSVFYHILGFMVSSPLNLFKFQKLADFKSLIQYD